MGSPHLVQALQRIQPALKRGARPIFVFDLDSTLLDTGQRHLAIFRDFAASTAKRQGPVWDALRALVPDLAASDFGYDVTDPLLAAGIRSDRLERALLDYWSDRYFTNEYCVVDEPAPGAVSYVVRAHAEGAFVQYLTGRPEERMRRGTEKTLQRHRFPTGEGTGLRLRPRDLRADKDFKVVAGRRIARQGEVVAQFENEPANANALIGIFPGAMHFLVGSVRSSAPVTPHESLLPIPDFTLP
ncbi:MAG: hypothetical protein KDA24_22105 [Deltaproteobacteria bacterium]|nr:hypothetical protein [Deltaproteobacteria bacterium]